MRAFVVAAVIGFGVMALSMLELAPAFAATVTEPSGGRVTITVDGSGYAAPSTVKARGFEPFSNVFIEQCNGRPPSAENWAPSLDCDLGSAPAPAVADANGVATFLATDPNHALYPFVGPGPQQLFNCLSAKGASPGNGLADFRDCQLRISTSNTAGTEDQVFLTMRLPEGARTGYGKPTFAAPQATSTQNATTASTVPKASGSGASQSSTREAASSEPGSGSSSSFPAVPVLLAIAVAAIGGAFFLLHKRRSGRVAA